MLRKCNPKHTYYCPTCGSTDISFDGQVEWDAEEERWILLEIHEDPWCDSCKDTISEAKFGDPTEVRHVA
ncbi:hypothetical protein [Stenotrophomonas maltophilia]|uniref:hypothetical protein n=1 Tax=Stenotrophomonas maltophilia TaxID=40324 RepID=UPI00066D6A17|nr:hypothetical protein [Stenotrophomonas maltophilia]KUJ02782.1 hypothetical protein AR275_24810 [Stenotrophomonas maltophilia]MBA0298813.1 hypothetical protein [Stenotrophomonas maltophilia]MBH1376182.1 hypothetical protein [Stenotrophomonas maltophilia]MBH1439137.1 hypothetical protein [Stenotrophomonas maltophilia]UXL28808.1 hypothetical protein N0O74_20640 [Stenotrophomonas maltophilia]